MENQKIDSELTVSLMATQQEKKKSSNLTVGFDYTTKEWEIIVKYNGNIDRFESRFGIGVEKLTSQYAILRLRENLINEISKTSEIEYIEKPKNLTIAMQKSKRVSCISKVYNPPLGLTGYGVIIGIIDSGIDFYHPDFINDDGTTRIISIWDQNDESGDPPKGFKTGTEYTVEMINDALKYPKPLGYNIVPSKDMSIYSHGTHVASIAGGNGRASKGKNSGVAVNSEFVIVSLGTKDPKVFPKTTQLMRGLKYIIDKATSLRKPVSINISYGNNYGSHNNSSLLETYFNHMSTFWKASIIVGAGNENISGHHTSGVLVSNSMMEIELGVGIYERSFNIQIWKSFLDEVDLQIINPSGDSTGFITASLQIQRYKLRNTELLVCFGMPSPFNKLQEIYIEFVPKNTYINKGSWKLQLRSKNVVIGHFDIWLPSGGQLKRDTKFMKPTTNNTLTVPSTASKVITVGAYNSHNNTIAYFSGRGSNLDSLHIKPDVVAPGVNVYAAKKESGYQLSSGTSVATPFVTGAVALLMEWGIVRGNDPYLYGEKMKVYLQKGAKELDKTLKYPNQIWGYGTLCLYDSFFDNK